MSRCISENTVKCGLVNI